MKKGCAGLHIFIDHNDAIVGISNADFVFGANHTE